MQLWLSSKTLQNISGFRRYISKMNDTSFISAINVNMPLITCLNTIYSAFVVLKAISVCNLLHPNNGYPAYVITYPVCGMTFSSL